MVSFLIECVHMSFPAYSIAQFITCPLYKWCDVSLCDFLFYVISSLIIAFVTSLKYNISCVFT